MERVRLTNERIKRIVLPPELKSRTGKPVNQLFLWDTEAPGLAIRATKAGAKSFIYQGRLKDKTEVRSTIGKCSVWTLEGARIEARRLQRLVDRGIDPRELEKEKRAEKVKKKEAAEAAKQEAEANSKYTLKALLDTYADHLEAQYKERTAAAVRSVVKCHLTEESPELSATPAKDVTAHDVAGLIRRIMEKGKGRTAGIFRSSLAAAYSCGRRAPFDAKLPSAFISFRIESNPVDPIPTIPVKARHRTLTQEELKGYMADLGDDLIDLALKLALFSGGQRMAQLLRAEVSDWNPDTRTLRLMDGKGKREEPREHLLPVGPIAASIITELVNRAETLETMLLFPSTTKKTPIHISMPGPRVAEIAKKIGGESFDLRDIRRTAETMLAGLGISRDIRAQLLSHGISGVQAVHYDKHSYTKEKRAALMKWERYLKRIISDGEEKKVIQFETAKGRSA